MTKKQGQKIFEKYNPAEAVTRCPKGRTSVRKTLDLYAKAAVNLYGLIPKAELAEIFNSQNSEQTDPDELFILLLPLVLKKKRWYCFYKDCIVHYGAMENFDYADYLLFRQGDKPRFIPEREEFFKFKDPFYESAAQELSWCKLREFIDKEWPDNLEKRNFLGELKDCSEANVGLKAIGELFSKYGLIFDAPEQVIMFFDLFRDAGNHTRTWLNKGHSSAELYEIQRSQHSKQVPQ